MSILNELRSRFRPVLTSMSDQVEPLLDMIRPAQDSKFGDYQANCAMPLGKQLKKQPREVAAEIIDQVSLDDICSTVDVAGPGFVNLTIDDDWLLQRLEEARHDERLGIPPVTPAKTYVIDYSAPNVAKPMHVGHIRSTVIGDSLCRILRFLGHKVVGDNHVGDWGTQFGMVIYGYRQFADKLAYQQHPVQELGRIYKYVRKVMDLIESERDIPKLNEQIAKQQETIDAASAGLPKDAKDAKKAKKAIRKQEVRLVELKETLASCQEKVSNASPELRKAAKQHAGIHKAVLDETAKLHQGDAENKKLWEEFLPKCRDEIANVYRRLGVTFDVELGESFYHDRLSDVVDGLIASGHARESEGAICVFMDEYDSPMIIRKSDGAFLYATTDLATIQYRMEEWRPDAILYVVDHRQGEHFGKLFAAAKVWGYDQTEMKHISFGTVLGEDGKPYKTRSGVTVGLEGLLDEAVNRAHQVVSDNDDAKPGGAELSKEDRDHIADVVGHAAIRYADLSQNRESDYVFSYDKMVAMQGNTATYMQYSYARVQSIFARGGVDIEQLRKSAASISIGEPAERTLALEILRFADALNEVTIDYRPNLLTAYLFDLAKRYSQFFDACPVLKADSDELKNSRLLLCDLTARTIKTGLSLLGIDVVDKM